MIGETGLEVTLIFPEYSKWIDYIVPLGDRVSTAADIVFYASSVDQLTPEVQMGKSLGSGGSVSGVDDPVMDGLIEDILATADLDEREAAYHLVWEYNYEQSYVPYLMGYNWIWGKATNLEWPAAPDAAMRPYIAEMSFVAEE
jgi:hypothetical protein